jgi:hypothetical protein
VLWGVALALIAGGLAMNWGSAVATTERYANFATSTGSQVETGMNWGYLYGALTMPLLAAGLCTLVVTLAVHAALWAATPREP